LGVLVASLACSSVSAASATSVIGSGRLPVTGVTDGGRSSTLTNGGVSEFSELATPVAVVVPAVGSIEIRDVLSRRLVVPRAVQVVTGTSVVDLPQLPVGSFLVTAPGFSAELRILPETGVPVELTGMSAGGRPIPGAVLVALGTAGLLLGVLLRRRGRLVLLGVVPILAAGGLAVLPAKPATGLSWDGCSAYTSSVLREQEVLRRDCRVRVILDMLGVDGSGRDDVTAMLATNTDQTCHEVAHLAGFYFSRLTSDLDVASKGLILGCNDGMVHGVLEAVGMFSSDEEFVARSTGLCLDAGSERVRKTCAHGVGHASLWRTVGNLDSAWELCSNLDPGPDTRVEVLFNRFRLTDTRYSAQVECRSAAVMEWADRWEFERIAGSTSVLVPALDEPMDICARYENEESFQVGCYLGTSYRTGDPTRAAERCNTEAPYPVSCFAVIGDNLVQFDPATLRDRGLDVEFAAEFSKYCRLAASGDAALACAKHLSMRFHLTLQSLPTSEELCATLDATLRPGCTEGITLASDLLAGRPTVPSPGDVTSTTIPGLPGA
jgi:hypothetical protein